MSDGALPIDKLRDYLRELTPGARALLLEQIDRSALEGGRMPGADLILEALRPALRRPTALPERLGNPARLFFRPLEPFIVDSRLRLRCPGA